MIENLFAKLSPDRYFQMEEREWQAANAFPNEVVRQYRSDSACAKDQVRLLAIGYRVERRELVDTVRLPKVSGGPHRSIQVTYSRQA